MSSSRSSSCSASIASCSCNRHFCRKAWLVDQSVSSNARRAASIALPMSSFDASATSPSGSSVAGLMLVEVPAAPSTSSPSIIIFDSNRTVGVSAIVVAFVGFDGAVTRKAHHHADYLVKSRGRQKSVHDQQHLGIETDRATSERLRAAQNLDESGGEPVGRLCAVLHREPAAFVHG